MLVLLNVLRGRSIDATERDVLNDAAVDSPLFRWMTQVFSVAKKGESSVFDHLEVSAINQSFGQEWVAAQSY